MRVLVTDAHTRAALAAVRSLARLGEVHVTTTQRGALASASRHVSACHRIAEPARSPRGFVASVAAVVASQRIDLVLPVSDAACRMLLGAREQLRPAVVAGPSARAFECLSDKAHVAAVAARVGIAVPPGDRADDLAGAERLARELGYPVILKPVASVALDARGRLRSAGVVRVDRERDLAAAWAGAAGDGAALVQRVVPGWGEGLFLLRSAGKTYAAFAHRRLREKPPQGGVSTLCESVAADPLEVSRVEALLDEAGFDGVAMAEFRTDGRERWLMEVNARLWGSVQLAIDAGVDFPRLLVELALGREPDPVRSYRVGIRSRWVLGDLDHALLLARSKGVAAALRVLATRTGPHCRHEVFRPDDPAPFAAELWYWLRALVLKDVR